MVLERHADADLKIKKNPKNIRLCISETDTSPNRVSFGIDGLTFCPSPHTIQTHTQESPRPITLHAHRLCGYVNDPCIAITAKKKKNKKQHTHNNNDCINLPFWHFPRPIHTPKWPCSVEFSPERKRNDFVRPVLNCSAVLVLLMVCCFSSILTATEMSVCRFPLRWVYADTFMCTLTWSAHTLGASFCSAARRVWCLAAVNVTIF